MRELRLSFGKTFAQVLAGPKNFIRRSDFPRSSTVECRARDRRLRRGHRGWSIRVVRLKLRVNRCKLSLDAFHLFEFTLKLVAALFERASHTLDIKHRVKADVKRVLHLVAQECVEVVDERHQEEAVELKLNGLNDVSSNAVKDLANQHVHNVHCDGLHCSVPQRVLHQIRELASPEILLSRDELATASTPIFFRVRLVLVRR